MTTSSKKTTPKTSAASKAASTAKGWFDKGDLVSALVAVGGHNLMEFVFDAGAKKLRGRNKQEKLANFVSDLSTEKKGAIQAMVEQIRRLDSDELKLTPEQKQAEKNHLLKGIQALMLGDEPHTLQAKGLAATLAAMSPVEQDRYHQWRAELDDEQGKMLEDRRDEITPTILISALRQFKPAGAMPVGQGLQTALAELEPEERAKFSAFYAVLGTAERGELSDKQQHVTLPILRTALAGPMVSEPVRASVPALNEVVRSLTPDAQGKFGSFVRALDDAGRQRLFALSGWLSAEQVLQALASENLRVPRTHTVNTLAEDLDGEAKKKFSIFLSKLDKAQGTEVASLAPKLTQDMVQRAVSLHSLAEPERGRFFTELTKLTKEEREKYRQIRKDMTDDLRAELEKIQCLVTADMLRIALEVDTDDDDADEEFVELLKGLVDEIPIAYALEEQVRQVLHQLKNLAALEPDSTSKSMEAQVSSILALMERAAATPTPPTRQATASEQAKPILDLILEQAKLNVPPTAEDPKAQAKKVLEAVLRDLGPKPEEVKPEDQLQKLFASVGKIFGEEGEDAKSDSPSGIPKFVPPARLTESITDYVNRELPKVNGWLSGLPSVPDELLRKLIPQGDENTTQYIKRYTRLLNEWFAGLTDAEKNGQEELKLDPPKFESEEEHNQRVRLARAEYTRRTGVVTDEQQRFNGGRWQGF
ncbi:hypothetical protein KKG46_06015 [Patescibacteria group bacterium]|nr:hypothetical protein [Patescibacteria group bacterium]